MQTIESRLENLERQNRRLMQALVGVLLFVGVYVSLSAAFASAAEDETARDILRLRMLEIVDDNGVVRVRVGAKLPDAVIDGRSIGRGGEEVAGVMLYDGTGQERGGYVTFEPSGNIGLTLDTRREQVALFAAGADGGATLRMWQGADAIELRADASGSRLTAVADGKVDVQIPEVEAMGDDACTAYRGARENLPREQIMEACSARFPAGLCQSCLDR